MHPSITKVIYMKRSVYKPVSDVHHVRKKHVQMLKCLTVRVRLPLSSLLPYKIHLNSAAKGESKKYRKYKNVMLNPETMLCKNKQVSK